MLLKYHSVVRVLRNQPAAKYFKEPVPWQKLGLTNYPEVISKPMDLLTVLRKLEGRACRMLSPRMEGRILGTRRGSRLEAPGLNM